MPDSCRRVGSAWRLAQGAASFYRRASTPSVALPSSRQAECNESNGLAPRRIGRGQTQRKPDQRVSSVASPAAASPWWLIEFLFKRTLPDLRIQQTSGIASTMARSPNLRGSSRCGRGFASRVLHKLLRPGLRVAIASDREMETSNRHISTRARRFARNCRRCRQENKCFGDWRCACNKKRK